MGTDPSCTNATSGCRVRVYKHGNHGGPNHGIAQNASELCRKDCDICVHVQGISSYEVQDCPETVVPIGHYREDAYSSPMGHQNPPIQDYALALDGRQNCPGGWNDNLWGITFHTVPEPNANQLSYEIPTNGIKRWPNERVIGPRDNTANRDDVLLRSGGTETGTPCPGGQGWFMKGGTKVRCLYDKSNDAALRTLYSNKDGVTSDPRASMWESLASSFCADPNNIVKNPGGSQTCLLRDASHTIAKQYCSVSNRISTNAACTVANLGDTYYRELAETYCKTPAGVADNWCSCYNVVNNVCDTNSAAAGCETKRLTFDKLVEKTPDKYKSLWVGRAPCFGAVCQGTKYIPTNANQNCGSSINICNQQFDMTNVTESNVEASCTINSGDGPSVNDGNGGGGGGGGGIGSYIPKSLDGLKTDRNQQIGLGGGLGLVGICVCCICVILVLLMSGGDGGGGGPTRFRRR